LDKGLEKFETPFFLTDFMGIPGEPEIYKLPSGIFTVEAIFASGDERHNTDKG